MGVACPGSGNVCPRVNYWSNPDVVTTKAAGFPKDGTPMGTADRNNCARVLNERATAMTSLLMEDDDVVVASSWRIKKQEYGDVIGIKSVQNEGALDVDEGGTLQLRTQGTITLKPGFTAKTGSTVTIKTCKATSC